jgi:hypothetical protein
MDDSGARREFIWESDLIPFGVAAGVATCGKHDDDGRAFVELKLCGE